MSKKRLALSAVFLMITMGIHAQHRYYSKTAKIEFLSEAALEDIEARNKAATVVLDTKTGALQITTLIKGFEFERALMQEHFNENYLESNKYPKADFKGNVTNIGDINLAKTGIYKAKVKGLLSMHGVTKSVETTGTFKVDGAIIKAESAFDILLSDFKIKIPGTVKEKVANKIRITVDTKLEPLK